MIVTKKYKFPEEVSAAVSWYGPWHKTSYY